MPNELSAAYDDAMDRIKAQDQYRRQVALRIIHWIFLAYRPLTVAEIKHALAVEEGDAELDPDGIPEDDQLISSCVGMVVVSEESGVMGFVHFTVQEYLEQIGPDQLTAPRLEIAQTCLTYLLFEDLAENEPLEYLDGKIVSAEFPLLGYAAQHWGDHVRCCNSYSVVEDKLLRYLSQPRATFRINADPGASSYESERQGPLLGRGVSPLCLAASFGLPEAVEQLLQRQKHVDIEDTKARSRALHMAVINDFPSVIKVLLSHGTDVNARDQRRWTPLHQAGSLGRADTVSLLLRSGADLNSKDGYRETPLSRCAEAGHVALVGVLLESGSEINSLNVMGQAAAHHAATMDYDEVLRVLVRWGADLGIEDHWGYDPWYRALEVNAERAAKFLFAEAMQRRQRARAS